MSSATDHDILVETHTMVKEVHKAVFGNGRPGLIEDLRVLETVVADIDKRAPSAREKQQAKVAIVVAVIASAAPIAVALIESVM